MLKMTREIAHNNEIVCAQLWWTGLYISMYNNRIEQLKYYNMYAMPLV